MPLHAQEEVENEATQQQQTRRRSPQASRGERNDKKDTGLPELTVRAQDMNERLTQEIGNASWMRIIYRQVDLMKEQNAPLYYPTRPMNGQMNLFSVIFQLLGENKIKAYEYLDGYEEFDEAHLINFKDLLDRFYILYEEIPGRAGEEPTFVINESDIPAADVRSYYVKKHGISTRIIPLLMSRYWRFARSLPLQVIWERQPCLCSGCLTRTYVRISAIHTS